MIRDMDECGHSLRGKVILITGATEGIGKYTALELARRGATVVIVGRNPQKTAIVKDWLQLETNHSSIHHLVADLSVQAQIRQLAAEFGRRFDRLDVLINNAGALFVRRQISAEGIEMNLALNHLSYFLLTDLLMDVLLASSPARVVNVSATAHFFSGINFGDLEHKRFYNGWFAYGQSKLANILFTYELARRVDPTRLTANALHPGYVATNFGRSNGGFYDRIFKLSHLVTLSPEEGARTPVFLASAGEMTGKTGGYYVNCKPAKSSRLSHDLQIAQRLWRISEKMTAL